LDAKPRRLIVLTTFGSLGDLHPFIALGRGLKERGHNVVLATSAFYQAKVEAEGLGFAPLRPNLPEWRRHPKKMARYLDLRRGTERVVKELVMPHIRASYTDLLRAAEGASLLVSHPLTYATPLVAEMLGRPWASTMLAPLGFASSYDPPVLPGVPLVGHIRRLSPRFYSPFFAVMKAATRTWSAPWHALRNELGLAPAGANPMFEGQHSPHLVLALFSRHFAAPQPDWPAKARTTGFVFYDRDGETQLDPALAHFLESGPAPIVFTLGSSAVWEAGAFYEQSIAAAKQLGQRAVLLTGRETGNRPTALPDGIIAVDYVPYSQIFPRASAIVHQGGIGATGQAFRAGKPALVMPYAYDQPDNAAHLRRLGVARVIERDAYTFERAAVELGRLLEEPAYAQKAAALGRLAAGEDGVQTACDALEELLR